MLNLPPYQRPWYLCNAHLETIWPALFRKPGVPGYFREQIRTADDDFLDLDWLRSGSKRLAIVSHGLEGDSRRHYVVGMAQALDAAGWDVLAWNFRGCGGEINCQPRFTHNGATDDLDAVVRHAQSKFDYPVIALVGFSMGGNLSLVYLGRDPSRVPGAVKAAVCFSVPCDLAAASQRLAEVSNAVYMRRFMRLMRRKVFQQARRFPEHFPVSGYRELRTFHDFDNRYTAPLHGFRDARHYWEECSGSRYLGTIRLPVWVVNAGNDPFLTPSCFPDRDRHGNRLVTLVTPQHGGHCGFASAASRGRYWSEIAAVRLLAEFT